MAMRSAASYVLSSFTTVFSNVGSYRRPPLISRLGTGIGSHYKFVQCVLLHYGTPKLVHMSSVCIGEDGPTSFAPDLFTDIYALVNAVF